jgi:hypothetical protein
LSAAPNVLFQRYKQYGQVCIQIAVHQVCGALIHLKVRCPGMVFGIQ